MKKNVFKSLLVAGIVAIGGYGISKIISNDSTVLDTLILANVEALADGETLREIIGEKGEWRITVSWRHNDDTFKVNCYPGGCSLCASPIDF